MISASGSFRSVFLYDLCEEIRLDELRGILGSPPAGREPGFRHLAPEYVRFERPPVTEVLETVELEGGERLRCHVNYYDYGVVSVDFELPFESDWERLVDFIGTWMAAPEVESKAAQIVRSCGTRANAALVKPYDYRLTEDYYIVQLGPIRREDGGVLSAIELIAAHGPDIARIVRGEVAALSEDERAEVLQSRLSYYPNDLLVVGWTAAVVYDTADGAAPTIQLLEYANSQLLEFRHYDHILTGLLSHVYDAVSSGTGFLARWRLAREAERLSTIQLDVRELTERVDNSIKFLSDTFAARVYRLAANRIGVPDYRNLVDQKLSTAGELYQFMMDRFHQGRAFVLELMVVIILIIELFYLFRGRR
ncbi:MAG: hypothetical protein M3Z23_02935 [Acidobacteriota bacterium]|nr:hypothetical protein [Acidobacteriota bacterium]